MEEDASSNLSKPFNIYIVGAQCTGKTTLVKSLERHFNEPKNCVWQGQKTSAPQYIIEVARGVLQEHSFTAEDITTSKSRAHELQMLILEAQLQAETAVGDTWFISDRSGFDPIVYAHRYVGDEAVRDLMSSDAFVKLKQRMEQALVVVCEAGADWLFDDGVRLMPTSKEEWINFHRLFCALLDTGTIGYVVLPFNMTDSTERVGFVLDKWRTYKGKRNSKP